MSKDSDTFNTWMYNRPHGKLRASSGYIIDESHFPREYLSDPAHEASLGEWLMSSQLEMNFYLYSVHNIYPYSGPEDQIGFYTDVYTGIRATS